MAHIYDTLHLAAEAGDTEACKALIAAGADVNAQTHNGSTPLHWAKNAEVCEVLIAYGADVNAQTHNGNTPLHLAAYTGRLSVCEPLIAAGADVNAQDCEGATPLHSAKNAEVCETLIAHGASATAQDRQIEYEPVGYLRGLGALFVGFIVYLLVLVIGERMLDGVISAQGPADFFIWATAGTLSSLVAALVAPPTIRWYVAVPLMVAQLFVLFAFAMAFAAGCSDVPPSAIPRGMFTGVALGIVLVGACGPKVSRDTRNLVGVVIGFGLLAFFCYSLIFAISHR